MDEIDRLEQQIPMKIEQLQYFIDTLTAKHEYINLEILHEPNPELQEKMKNRLEPIMIQELLTMSQLHNEIKNLMDELEVRYGHLKSTATIV